MNINESIIERIQFAIFTDNIKMNPKNSIFISHVKDNLFCLITKRNDFSTVFFTEDSPKNMNTLFRNFIKIMITKDLCGDGCFDHQSPYKHTGKDNRSILEKTNKYYDSQNTFLLLKFNKKSISVVSFMSFNNGYIWSVCTGIKFRKKRLMSILFEFFFNLYESTDTIFVEKKRYDGISMWLLYINPEFEGIKKFYLKLGFKIKNTYSDKIVLNLT